MTPTPTAAPGADRLATGAANTDTASSTAHTIMACAAESILMTSAAATTITASGAHGTAAPARPLVLASTSPYRRELLGRLRLPFEVAAPGVDEAPLPGEDAAGLARRLALAKAEAVAALHPGALVIGSDQAAQLGDAIVGKPGGHAAAVAQLRAASGRAMEFHTAVALIDAASGRRWCETVPTRVLWRALSDEEIQAYLEAEPAYDCAGSAKAEGLGISLLESLESPDPTALIGLPLIALARMLREAGLALPGRAA